MIADRTADRTAGDLSPGARVGVYVVALAAAVLSFDTLARLAWSTGSTGNVLGLFPVAWLLPIALDAAAGVGTFVWRRARRSEVTQLARRIVWAAIALSITGNATQHAHQAADVRPGVLVAIAVGAVAPAVFGAVVHLAVVASAHGVAAVDQGGRAARPEREDDQSDRPQVVGEEQHEGDHCTGDAGQSERGGQDEKEAAHRSDGIDQPVDHAVDVPPGPVEGPLTLVETARALLAQPDPPGDRALATALGVTRHRARQLVIEAENGLAEVSA